MKVKPEGILRDAEGNQIGVIAHHIVGDDGLTTRERNMQTKHNFAIGSLVEITYGEYCGLRLFVAEHSRDCDGTPLYALTHTPKYIGRKLAKEKERAINDIDGFLCAVHLGALNDGWSESSLVLIKSAKEISAQLGRD